MNGMKKVNDINNNHYGKCVCDEDKGFQIKPNEKINMCICKENYSFYKDIEQCKPNTELGDGKYIKAIEINSGIKIYDDCYENCKSCSIKGTLNMQNCIECKRVIN